MREPAFCKCKNKGADQLWGNHKVDQHLCFGYIDSTMPLLSKSEISVDVRGMIKNNVDFCYKKLYSQHRLIQTKPFRFGNCMGSENKIFVLIYLYRWCTGCFFYNGNGHPGQSIKLHS